ncbi:MAG: hypothetical protein MHM6MM_004395 [Cercozoa sp. M6MM]
MSVHHAKKIHKHVGGKRVRVFAHVNPLSDGDYAYPRKPEDVDWHAYFPHAVPPMEELAGMTPEQREQQKKVSFVDIGCGFGAFLLRLGELFPEELGLGLEIRDKAVEFVQERIDRAGVKNVGVHRTNVMKYLVHYFEQGQLDKMFFCFPDPHFKRKNWRRRIISPTLLSQYAYVLRPGGRIYNVTDVEELHKWTVDAFATHPLFERIPEEELADDKAVHAMRNDTDEAKRVAKRPDGRTYVAVYRRLADDAVADDAEIDFTPMQKYA